MQLQLGMPETAALSVRELTQKIKALLDNSPEMGNVTVRGEVSNLKDHPSGHLYFTMKDEAASIRCVMFRGRREVMAKRCRSVWNPSGSAVPANGEVVVARGYVSLYERDGQYQLYVQDLWREGELRLGELYRALEELKARLKEEGLFEESRKKPLPMVPRVVGVVTSPTAAALRDICRIAWRRFPNAHLILVPSLVQGERAPQDIGRAIELANRHPLIDVLIVGRGGGSIEELWAFNTEEVARAIARSRVPVVSAVGHETDFTIADLVADVRAPTPSGAAEMVLPEKSVVQERLWTARKRLLNAVKHMVSTDRQRLGYLSSRPALARPVDMVNQRRQRLDDLQYRLRLAVRYRVDPHRHAYLQVHSRLLGLNPLAVLRRGYSLCLDQDGRPVRSYKMVAQDQGMTVVVSDGAIKGRVETAIGLPGEGAEFLHELGKFIEKGHGK